MENYTRAAITAFLYRHVSLRNWFWASRGESIYPFGRLGHRFGARGRPADRLQRSSEEILFGSADKRARGTFGGFPFEAAQQHHRTSGRLAHQNAGRGGKLVRNRYDCASKLPAAAVYASSVVFKWSESRDANGDVHQPFAPGAAEGVGYDESAAA